ncbi:hypothetical protein L6R29_22955 [Myxococcota bacterium]|nr:hypothetical protein [Myxococcota bacterium]
MLSDPKTFETWGFSLFWDVLPAPDSAFASLPVGEPLPSKPQLVRADDQKPHVWLIDGVYRRHVASMKILLKTLPTQERPVARLCRAVDVELLRLPPFLLVCFGSLCLF